MRNGFASDRAALEFSLELLTDVAAYLKVVLDSDSAALSTFGASVLAGKIAKGNLKIVDHLGKPASEFQFITDARARDAEEIARLRARVTELLTFNNEFEGRARKAERRLAPIAKALDEIAYLLIANEMTRSLAGLQVWRIVKNAREAMQQ